MATNFIVYLTIYRGNKLPPFYIGNTREDKILKGYNGYVKSKRYKDVWKKERLESPNLFKTLILQRFKTCQEAMEREEILHRKLNVVNNPLYINMAIANGRFGGAGENSPNFGKPRYHTPETREKISKNHADVSGKKNPLFGKPRSKETKQKISVHSMGKSGNKGTFKEGHIPWTQGKILGPRPKEVREKIRSSLTGVSKGPQEIICCPHCKKSGGVSVMRRWHFDNCPHQRPSSPYGRTM